MRLRAWLQTGRLATVATATVVLLFWAATGCAGGGGHHDAGAPVDSSRPSATTGAPTTQASTTTVPAPTAPPPPTATPPPPQVGGRGVAVGDSVLEDVALYAPATLESRNIAINAAVGRQWDVGVGMLSALRASGALPPVVVVALGSNGRVTTAAFDQMMHACAGAKRVVFMTVTGPLIGNNPTIAAGVARYPQAQLADWNTLATANPSWFGPDHVHVGPAGAAALGNLLASFS